MGAPGKLGWCLDPDGLSEGLDTRDFLLQDLVFDEKTKSLLSPPYVGCYFHSEARLVQVVGTTESQGGC